MQKISLKDLLESGAHFGHQASKWNPKASEFIYAAKDKTHVIDLAKTGDCLLKAGEFLHSLAKDGKTIIFLGTKRQAVEIINFEAKRAGVFYVTQRWPGGLLTNFEVISKNFKKLKALEEKLKNDEEKAKYTKKEIHLWQIELDKLKRYYEGVKDLTKVPDALFVVDARREAGAIREAKRLGAAVVAIVDTNTDPTPIDYPIPANDDAVGSIKYITSYLAEAWLEGKSN